MLFDLAVAGLRAVPSAEAGGSVTHQLPPRRRPAPPRLAQVSTLPRLASLELGGSHLALGAESFQAAGPLLARHGLSRLVFEGRWAVRGTDTNVFNALTSLKV